MNVTGDIKVWVENDRACARLTATSHEGPIVVQASAPLAAIRRRVAEVLEKRGHDVSGNDVGFDAVVNMAARRAAMGRLINLVPSAFIPGGIATQLAIRAIKRRRRARRQLARGGRPVGPKSIGPLPPPPEDDAEPDMDELDDVDSPDERGGAVSGESGAYIVGATPSEVRAAGGPSKVRKAMRLLSAAKKNRAAAQRVKKIGVLAAQGSPQGQVALKALKVADQAQKAQKAQARQAPRLPAARSPLALLTAAQAAAAPPAHRPRSLFWGWDPEILRRHR